MFELHEVAPNVHQIALPAPNGIPEPWGRPRNVYVVGGESPSLIDTGYAATADQLHAALGELGIAPEHIQRIALTSLTQDAIGAAHTFPYATCWTALQKEHGNFEPLRLRYQEILHALLAFEDKPKGWTAEYAESVTNQVFVASNTPVQYLESGLPLRLGNIVFDALETRGVAYGSCGYYAADRGWLFPGPSMALSPRSVMSDPGAMLDTLGELGGMSVKKILPVRGPVDDVPDIFFRTLSLYATNIRSNMQYVFEDPVSSIDLVLSDFGYLPDDLFDFANRLLIFDAIFREFAEAGVIHQKSEGQHPAFPRYSMGAPDDSRAQQPASQW